MLNTIVDVVINLLFMLIRLFCLVVLLGMSFLIKIFLFLLFVRNMLSGFFSFIVYFAYFGGIGSSFVVVARRRVSRRRDGFVCGVVMV